LEALVDDHGHGRAIAAEKFVKGDAKHGIKWWKILPVVLVISNLWRRVEGLRLRELRGDKGLRLGWSHALCRCRRLTLLKG